MRDGNPKGSSGRDGNVWRPRLLLEGEKVLAGVGRAALVDLLVGWQGHEGSDAHDRLQKVLKHEGAHLALRPVRVVVAAPDTAPEEYQPRVDLSSP